LTSPDGWTQRQTFVPSLWPYMEQASLTQAYNYNQAFWSTENLKLEAIQVPMYSCPSDRQGLWMADTYGPRARGNYVVNWGYCDYWQTVAKPDGTNPMKLGPFRRSLQSSVADIRDGLSNTLFMGEIIQPGNDTDYDFRSDFFNDDRGAAMFMSLYTPNSGVDKLAFCVSMPEVAPCTTGISVYVSTRSRHSGGVSIGFGDGSVHFISDSIALTAWRWLSSMAGDEAVSGSEY
jgi:prepilin-type processing-associated H-X9-DG protein